MNALKALRVQNSKKPSGIKPLPLLKGADGQVLDNAADVAQMWREHFREQEDGILTDFDSLLHSDGLSRTFGHVFPLWDELPSLFQIECQFRKTSIGRSFFADGVPGDLLKKAPAKMACA